MNGQRQHTQNSHWIWKANSIFRNSEAQWPWEQQLAKRRRCPTQYSLNIANVISSPPHSSPADFSHWPKSTVVNQLFTFGLDNSFPTLLWSWANLQSCQAYRWRPTIPTCPWVETDAEKVCDRCLITEMNSGQLDVSVELGPVSKALSHKVHHDDQN